MIFLEGCRVAEIHPSLAGVAFVAAIEAIAGQVFDVAMCSCGQHRDTAARFRATAALVSSPAEIEALADDYKIRSKLVHQGVLPGSETVHGTFGSFDPYARDAIEKYEMETLPRMKWTACALLALALRNELPARSKLVVEHS